MDKVRDIEQRVQSLSSVLASPVGEGDCAEKGRRAELKRFVLGTCTNIKRFAYPSLRKLDGVITKLKPLSKEHVLLGFLRNDNNTKSLAGFVQELSDAIMDYQVRASSPVVIFNEHPARF